MAIEICNFRRQLDLVFGQNQYTGIDSFITGEEKFPEKSFFDHIMIEAT